MNGTRFLGRVVCPASKALLAHGALLLALLAAGCSSVKTRVDNGPVQAHSFSFLDPSTRHSPDYAEDRKQAHAVIQQSIANHLQRRGLNYVASGGDVTVAYLILVANGVSTVALNSYFGYPEEADALMEHAQSNAADNNSRAAFESGTLVVDLVDPHSSKLLQRRTIHANLLRDLPTAKRTERVQAIVDQALNDLPL